MKAFAKIKPKATNKTVIENKAVLQIVYRPQIYITAQGIIQPHPRMLKNHVIQSKIREIDRHTIQKPIAMLSNQQRKKKRQAYEVQSNSNPYSVKLEQEQQLVEQRKLQTLSFSNLIPQQNIINKQAVQSEVSSISNPYSVKLESEQHIIQLTKARTLSFSNLIPQQKKIDSIFKNNQISGSPESRKRRQIFSSQDKLLNKLKFANTPNRQKKTIQSQNQPFDLNFKQEQNVIRESPIQIFNANNSNMKKKSQSKIDSWPIQQNYQQNISCFQYLFNGETTQPTSRKAHRKIFNKTENAFTKKKTYFQTNLDERSNPSQKTAIKQKQMQQNKMVKIQKIYSSIVFRKNVIKLGQYRSRNVRQKLEKSKIHSASYMINSKQSQSSISIQVISVQYGAPFDF